LLCKNGIPSSMHH